MVKPNFLIVGAPKCGTTSLAYYLGQHKDVFIPTIKEPHFFGSDLSYSEFKNKEDKYLSLFKNSNSEQRGEASTWYLFSKTAAREIYEFNPEMKIIMMIRDPVKAAVSLHSQALFSANEDITSFRKAWELEKDRIAGKSIPKNTKRVESLFYTEAYKYSDQIKRYIKLFGVNNVHIVLFDSFIKDTLEIVRGTFNFLGINDLFVPSLEVKNQRKIPRSQFIHNLIQKKDKKITKLIPVVFRRKLHHLLKSLNSRAHDSASIDEETRMCLFNVFRNEIDKTEYITGLNLNDWKNYQK